MRLPVFGRASASYDRAFVEAMARAYLEQTPWTRLRLAAVRDLVEPRSGERVLDLGCAAGAVTHFLSTFGCEVVGVDSEPGAVEAARGLFPGLRFEIADVALFRLPRAASTRRSPPTSSSTSTTRRSERCSPSRGGCSSRAGRSPSTRRIPRIRSSCSGPAT